MRLNFASRHGSHPQLDGPRPTREQHRRVPFRIRRSIHFYGPSHRRPESSPGAACQSLSLFPLPVLELTLLFRAGVGHQLRPSVHPRGVPQPTRWRWKYWGSRTEGDQLCFARRHPDPSPSVLHPRPSLCPRDSWLIFWNLVTEIEGFYSTLSFFFSPRSETLSCFFVSRHKDRRLRDPLGRAPRGPSSGRRRVNPNGVKLALKWIESAGTVALLLCSRGRGLRVSCLSPRLVLDRRGCEG